MKISSQEEYGLRCLLRLARAEGASLTIPEIAAAEGLSVPYVGKLLAVLRQAGLIDSVRG
ncbi:MAG: Rrf2 family transcriptional regulator, partial [Planctomycetes bacterium]|nr:Rrf2 family transcriptional regulator [Planctomycetota bacterium]